MESDDVTRESIEGHQPAEEDTEDGGTYFGRQNESENNSSAPFTSLGRAGYLGSSNSSLHDLEIKTEELEGEDEDRDEGGNFDLKESEVNSSARKDRVVYGSVEKNHQLLCDKRISAIFCDALPTKPSYPAYTKASIFDGSQRECAYSRSLEVLLLRDGSWPHARHDMKPWSGVLIASCLECEAIMVGPWDAIDRCTCCGLRVHSACRALLDDDCLPRDEKTQNEEATKDSAKTLEGKTKDGNDALEALRLVFNVDPEIHQRRIEEAEKVTEDPSRGWLAKITIKVICAVGLSARDRGQTSDPYVTVQLGKARKKTKVIPNDLNPVWNETFTFESRNYRDKIKVRVWDKDYSVFDKTLFKSSNDEFLGQKIIYIRTLSGQSDRWYILERRYRGVNVSGSIRLEIEASIDGLEEPINFYAQYACLHHYAFRHLAQGSVTTPCVSVENERNLEVYFRKDLQEIVDKFAQRYEIESSFRVLVHFSCLCERYAEPGHLDKLRDYLERAMNIFGGSSTPSFVSVADKMEACNFGKQNFLDVLDQLSNCLKITLSSYRDFYPSVDNDRLLELSKLVDLLMNVTNFKAEILEAPKQASVVVKQCINSCLECTYASLFAHCPDLYACGWPTSTAATAADDGMRGVREEGPGCKWNLNFWCKLACLVASAIEEDSKAYSAVLDRFPEDFKLEQMSSSVLWKCFKEELHCALEEHIFEADCKNHEYVNLHHKVNVLYDQFVLPHDKSSEPPEHPEWFEPFINRWLKDNDEICVTHAMSAYRKDKEHQFQRLCKKYCMFSSSVTDVFAELSQCYEVIPASCGRRPEIKRGYVLTFSMTIKNVLLTYSGLLMKDFQAFLSKTEIACVLLNDVQQLRVDLQRLYINMGGEKLPIDSSSVLTEVQKTLSQSIDELVALFCSSMKKEVDKGILLMRDILAKQNGGGRAEQADEDQKMMEASRVMAPLFDHLDSTLSTLASRCCRTVFRRILKELWTLVLQGIEYHIVLPPLSNSQAEQPSESLMSRLFKSPLRLTPSQCDVLEIVLVTFKKFFWAHDKGLRLSYLEGSPAFLALVDALIVSSQTTEVLIKMFMDSQTNRVLQTCDEATEENFGILSMTAKIVPGKNESTLTLTVASVEGIVWPGTAPNLNPYVQLTLLGPKVSGKKRSQKTKSIGNEKSPKFNETFHFSLGRESDLGFFEVHFCLKDHCFLRRDRVIGVAAFQLKAMADRNLDSFACQIPLKSSVHVDNIGDMVLRALAQRSKEEKAREFVRIKMESRHKF